MDRAFTLLERSLGAGEARERFGAINGVIHAAGVFEAGVIQPKTRASADAVLAPKVCGTMILFDLLKRAQLDFMVLFSSISSVLSPYALADYTAANSFLDAFAFFTGVNYLKSYILKSNSTGQIDAALLARSREYLALAAAISEKSTDEYFQQIARRSAQIFLGITFVYAQENDKAFELFKEAAKSTYPELRARALSDLGYVSLLRGNLAEAKGYFVRALEADPKFPYAQTNLGYAYLAEGRYDAARDLFSKLTKDDELRKNSLRDIVLSELAVAHIEAEQDGTHAPNPEAYTQPLKEMGIFNYEGMEPPLLRLAMIRLALADRIYMSHDYYGLEMFALAMYARAYFEAQSLAENSQAAEAASKALVAFRTVAATIDQRCFIFHTAEGFFKPVAELAAQTRLGVLPEVRLQ